MEKDNRQQPSQQEKAAPQNVSGNSEAQTKQKTEPITEEDNLHKDKDEGNMDNGELGAGLKSE
jgi:hypothetical protein